MNKNIDVKKQLDVCAESVEDALAHHMVNQDGDLGTVFDAQRYSLLGGGKRIRPYLVLAFCRMLGGTKEKAMPLACALEMIHTYSLIHDDLPCMDNDDYRRGRLTNHKVYGEANAVLAGDALLTKAFEIVSAATELTAQEKVEAVTLLATSAGACGMIGGQTMDMAAECSEQHADETYLVKMHGLKTGALIKAAAQLGCIAAGRSGDSDVMQAAQIYAEKIGLCFQVVDDILDVTGDAEALGKNIGVDSAANKLTFMKFYSVDQANNYAERLTEEAIQHISPYDRLGELCALAKYLLGRKH